MWWNKKTPKDNDRGWSYESKCKKHLIRVYCVLESVLDVLKLQGTSEGEGYSFNFIKEETKRATARFEG